MIRTNNKQLEQLVRDGEEILKLPFIAQNIFFNFKDDLGQKRELKSFKINEINFYKQNVEISNSIYNPKLFTDKVLIHEGRNNYSKDFAYDIIVKNIVLGTLIFVQIKKFKIESGIRVKQEYWLTYAFGKVPRLAYVSEDIKKQSVGSNTYEHTELIWSKDDCHKSVIFKSGIVNSFDIQPTL